MKNYLKLLGAVVGILAMFAHPHQAQAQALATLQCPLANTTYVTMGGDQYTSDAGGLVTNTGGGRNQTSVLAQGCSPIVTNPGFDATNALGNAVPRTIVGSTTVAAINAGSNTILSGVSGHSIYVISFDLVASGTPATCTGVYLEDDAGSPVVAATVLVAALGSGVHALPLAANTGAGFSSGGLTAGKDLQINVDGSACITMTKLTYAITYIVQ